MPALIRQWLTAMDPGSRRKPKSSETISHAQSSANVTADERDAVAWYLKQAQDFERSKVQAAEENARIASSMGESLSARSQAQTKDQVRDHEM